MTLDDLIRKRHTLNCDILNCLNNEVLLIKHSAEHMVECATNIKGQGYPAFIQAREEFLSRIDSLRNQIEESSIINSCTRC